MADEFLSQDEVDALLKGVGSAPEDQPDKPSEGVRGFNIGDQDRGALRRMPALELINSRFERHLRSGLFEFIRKTPDITTGQIRPVKYEEFIRSTAAPTNINIVQMRPLRGNALFIIDPALVFAVVDHMFGGRGNLQARVDGRDFTPTEYRIIRRILAILLQAYQACWLSTYAVEFEFVRSEMHPQFAGLCAPSDMVLATSFKVSLDPGGGVIQICIPYSNVEPIREILHANAKAESAEPDRRWTGMLKKQMQSAEVEMVAHLASIPVSIQQILNMNTGDVLSVEMPGKIVADVEGVPLFDCHYGTSNGRYALKVDRVLAISPQENMLGEERV